MNRQIGRTQVIELDEVLEAIKRPLATLKGPEGEEARALLDSARLSQERAVFDVISDVASLVNENSQDTRVHLEYEGRRFVVRIDSPPESETRETFADPEEDFEKVTIRLPKSLKAGISEAASAQGVSLNSWYIATLARSIDRSRRRGRGPALGPDSMRGGRRGRRGRRHSAPRDESQRDQA